MGMGHAALGPPSSEATFPPLLARTPLPRLGASWLDCFSATLFKVVSRYLDIHGVYYVPCNRLYPAFLGQLGTISYLYIGNHTKNF